jgi:hypothetical protein
MEMIIATYPAYTIINPGTYGFLPGDEFAIARETRTHGTLWDFYRLGSVEDYALQYNEDPAEHIARATERGENLYWANLQGVTLSAHRQAHKYVRGVKLGDVITFKGKSFRLDPAPNRNVTLTEVET